MKAKQIGVLACALLLALAVVALLVGGGEEGVVPADATPAEESTTTTTATPVTLPPTAPTVPDAIVWSEKTVNAEMQAVGSLVLVDSAYQNSAITLRTVPMRAESASYVLQAEACTALESMMTHYAGYSLSVLYAKAADSTAADAICYAGAFSSGLDVCFVGKEGGERLDFYRIGSGKNWLYQNCTRFGFVPCQSTATDWRAGWFRYVGIPHASLMQEKGLSLTDYLAILRTTHTDYTSAWQTAQNAQSYRIFYCALGVDGIYRFSLPKGWTYTVSGDNRGGIVVVAFGS